MGLTMIDALDSMYIMGFKDELSKSHDWISKNINDFTSREVSFFETTIRCLGGFMGIYDLTNDELYLEKAKLVGERLSYAFQTNNGLPLSHVNLKTGHKKAAGWTGGAVLLAEVGTVQLEFQSLSDRTGIKKFGDYGSHVFEYLDPKINDIKLPLRGQYPLYLDTNSVRFRNSKVSWGAMGDSFYEYLLKFWIYTGKKDDSRYRRMFVEAAEGLYENLYKLNKKTGLYYVGEWSNGRFDSKMDELTCFTGGTMALAYLHQAGFTQNQNKHFLEVAEGLGETCYQMFIKQKSGVSPEFVRFNEGSGMVNGQDYYILRPETVETLMYLYRITGNNKWKEKGWEIYNNIENSCKCNDNECVGYSPILSVGNNPRKDPRGVMHSFFLAETLKYLYLMFSNEHVIPLDTFVFNTEAHTIKITKDTLGIK